MALNQGQPKYCLFFKAQLRFHLLLEDSMKTQSKESESLQTFWVSHTIQFNDALSFLSPFCVYVCILPPFARF